MKLMPIQKNMTLKGGVVMVHKENLMHRA